MSTLEGLPEALARVELDPASATLTIDASVYPLSALYGASYIFIDRCYVLLDRPDPAHYRVTLAPKKPGADAEALRALVGEFANELLSCAWRAQIAEENRALIESVTTSALAGAMGPPSLDELEKFDFTDESFEDPLGIAMSWEDKYKKKDKAAEGAKGAEAAPAAPAAPAEAPQAADKGGEGAEGGA
jgi:His-Xaa-Ser system protein HxsD